MASFGYKKQNIETVDQSLLVICFKFPVGDLSGKFKLSFLITRINNQTTATDGEEWYGYRS